MGTERWDALSNEIMMDEAAGDIEETFEYEAALTRYELVMVAATALDSMSSMDYGIMSKAQQHRREQVMRKSMRIIHSVIDEIYDEIFEERQSPEQSDTSSN